MDILPFALLLALIALGPLLFAHWWEKYYWMVSLGLGGFVAGRVLISGEFGAHKIFETLVEYSAFVALIGSLYVVSGGVRIKLHGHATAGRNAALLAIGALMANFVGTTGASMLLIRPFLRFNHHRMKPYLIVFFIFLVSNIGGALTPIGDPPLFLGYLKGVPFFFMVEHMMLEWGVIVLALLAIFFLIDKKSGNYSKPKPGEKPFHITTGGLGQVWWLVAILGLVLVQKDDSLQRLPHAAVSLTIAALMAAIAVGSLRTAQKEILAENQFTYGPLKEVAALFAGIFLTMIPALEFLSAKAPTLGLTHPWQYFVGTGLLSSALDNAPTYLTFLSVTLGVHGLNIENPGAVTTLLQSAEGRATVEAISLGAVFWGAMTYIGNGPNFMVKNIAISMHAPAPSFVDYLWKYAIPILMPLFAAMTLVFWLIG
ncbi:sodium:proton antiporter [soil metagenome]